MTASDGGGTFVLLHGFTGSPRSWDPMAERLPPGSRVVRPTLAGHGSADARSWDEEVERIRRALVRDGVRDAHLCGYSMGGRLAWSLLSRAPALFREATLVGAHPGLDDPRSRAEREEADGAWIALLDREGVEAFVRAWEALPLWASQARLPAERLVRQRAIRSGHRARGLATALSALGLAQMPMTDPSAIAVPVHLVVGGLDHKHRELARRILPGLPRGRLAVVEGVGHNVVLEAPERLAALLAG